MNAYFCEKTGVRIAAPGVCKAVDPVGGQNEFSEPNADALASNKPAEKAPAKSTQPAASKADDK